VDLAAYGRVARRFWWVLLIGTVVAVALAILSTARITPHGLKYRKAEVWQSQTLLLLTQAGFPWGRTVQPSGADPSSLAGSTDLYSQFANSDIVRKMMRHDGAPKTWKINAVPASTSNSAYSASLPVIAMFGTAPSAHGAVSAVLLGRKAFLAYVTGQQTAAAIPDSQRVVIQVLQNSTPPELVKPRKKTLPIVVFLAMMTLTVGLALVLENLRPRHPKVALAVGTSPVRSAAVGARRTTL
jgi:hypothetical protein